jgi:hypothetical protein
VKNAWDGTHLKLTFRRTVNQRLLSQCYELLDICSSIQFSEDSDYNLEI